MPNFFSVSRGDITGLNSLDLFPRDSTPIYNLQNHFNEEDAKNLIDSLYPEGISNHGRQYLYDRYHWVYDQKQVSYASYLPMLELTFELVRFWRFPHRPSRFQSLFGCLTIDDARRFKTERCGNAGNIYLVSTDSFFQADMNLLYTTSIPGNILLADKYWSGQQSPNPFFEILMKAPVNILERIE